MRSQQQAKYGEDENGASAMLANVGVHLEGVMTVPNDPSYGALAGKIIAGAEGQSRMYVIAPDGSTTFYNMGVAIEDIDFISGAENFFGVNYGTGRILGAEASQFASLSGQILLTQEFPSGGGSGLYTLKWDSLNNIPITEQLTLAAGSFSPGQWEHVTFAPAGIVEIPPVPTPDLPSTAVILGLGVISLGFIRRYA